jgi:DNA-binding response OmpR family regulator
MGEGALVLIIDDDCDIHFFLKSFFRKMGMRTLHAETLKEAKSKVLANPSFIFLDNQLPDGLGVDNIPQFQSLASNAVIVVMTAYMPQETKNQAIAEGVDFFIEKPFSLGQLREVIGQVMQSQ